MSEYNKAIEDCLKVCDEFINERKAQYKKADDKSPWTKQLFLGGYKTAESIREAIKRLLPANQP